MEPRKNFLNTLDDWSTVLANTYNNTQPEVLLKTNLLTLVQSKNFRKDNSGEPIVDDNTIRLNMLLSTDEQIALLSYYFDNVAVIHNDETQNSDDISISLDIQILESKYVKPTVFLSVYNFETRNKIIYKDFKNLYIHPRLAQTLVDAYHTQDLENNFSEEQIEFLAVVEPVIKDLFKSRLNITL